MTLTPVTLTPEGRRVPGAAGQQQDPACRVSRGEVSRPAADPTAADAGPRRRPVPAAEGGHGEEGLQRVRRSEGFGGDGRRLREGPSESGSDGECGGGMGAGVGDVVVVRVGIGVFWCWSADCG